MTEQSQPPLPEQIDRPLICVLRWLNADKTAVAGTINGEEYSSIPVGSSMFRTVQKWIDKGNEPAPVPVPPFDREAVKNECQRRIYNVASTNCQMNMTAFIASGNADDAAKAAFNSALGWVQAMRGAYAQLVAAQDETFADDAHWPACPPDAVALASQF